MPRRSSSFKKSSNRHTSSQSAPMNAKGPPAQTNRGSGLGSGFLGTIFQGMAFGGGSEIAHTGLRSLMGGDSVPQSQHEVNDQNQTATNTGTCETQKSRFVDCLKFNNN
jgi:hypothetical protein